MKLSDYRVLTPDEATARAATIAEVSRVKQSVVAILNEHQAFLELAFLASEVRDMTPRKAGKARKLIVEWLAEIHHAKLCRKTTEQPSVDDAGS